MNEAKLRAPRKSNTRQVHTQTYQRKHVRGSSDITAVGAPGRVYLGQGHSGEPSARKKDSRDLSRVQFKSRGERIYEITRGRQVWRGVGRGLGDSIHYKYPWRARRGDFHQ